MGHGFLSGVSHGGRAANPQTLGHCSEIVLEHHNLGEELAQPLSLHESKAARILKSERLVRTLRGRSIARLFVF
jgi:hypothetical protein